MRPFRLARIAAEAEVIRLRGMTTRIVTQVILGVIALFFVLGAVVFVHLAAWYEVRVAMNQSYLATSGVLGGADLLLAIILGFLATRSKPSRAEIAALEVRRTAIEGISSALSVTQMALLAVRLLSDLRRRWQA
jgi:hypothetical protein